MSNFDFDQSESVEGGGGKYVKKPGKYHFLVTELNAEAINKNGQPIDGLKVGLEVVEGTDKTQIGHILETILFRGKPTDKDQGELANKKLTRLSLAFGGQHSPGGKGGINTETDIGKQLVAEVAERERDNKKFIDLAYAEIYHVDDPAVAAVPKSADALKLIPPALRKKFDPPSAGSTTSTPITPAPSGTNGAVMSAPVALDNI
jgi:hypothetical protein